MVCPRLLFPVGWKATGRSLATVCARPGCRSNSLNRRQFSKFRATKCVNRQSDSSRISISPCETQTAYAAPDCEMKSLLIIVAGIVLLVLVYLMYQGRVSRSGGAPGLIGESLIPCPDRPNCVCSENRVGGEHYIEQFKVRDGDMTQAMKRVARIIREIGGDVDTDSENYISATFASSIFGFVDDVEIRADARAKVIHVRSASRVGRSDLGANRKRMELIRQRFLTNAGS